MTLCNQSNYTMVFVQTTSATFSFLLLSSTKQIIIKQWKQW